MRPIYDYWQILAVLEDTVPYVRPTLEEVEERDTVLEDEDDGSDQGFDTAAFSFNDDAFDF